MMYWTVGRLESFLEFRGDALFQRVELTRQIAYGKWLFAIRYLLFTICKILTQSPIYLVESRM